MRYITESQIDILVNRLLDRVSIGGLQFICANHGLWYLKKAPPKDSVLEYLQKKNIYQHITGVLYGDDSVKPTAVLRPRPASKKSVIDYSKILGKLVKFLDGYLDGYICIDRKIPDGDNYIDLTCIEKSEMLSGKRVSDARTQSRVFLKRLKQQVNKDMFLYFSTSPSGRILATLKINAKFDAEVRLKNLFQLKKLISESLYKFTNIQSFEAYQETIDTAFADWINDDFTDYSQNKLQYSAATERNVLRKVRDLCKDNLKIALASPNPTREIEDFLSRHELTKYPQNFDNLIVDYKWVMIHILKDLKRHGTGSIGKFHWYQVVLPKLNSDHHNFVKFLAASNELHEKSTNKDRISKFIFFNPKPLE